MRRRATAGAAVLWAVGIAGLAGQAVLDARIRAAGLPGGYYPGFEVDPFSWLWLGTFVTMGALVAGRRPGNPIGWLMLAAGLCFIDLGAAGAWASYGLFVDRAWPGARLAAWLSDAGFTPPVLLVLAILVLFPDGRLPSRRWRVVLWALAVLGVVGVLGDGLEPGPLVNWREDAHLLVANPFGLGPLSPDVVAAGNSASTGILTLLVPVCVAPLVLRLRRSRGAERQQLKWLGFGAALTVAGLLAGIALQGVLGDQLGTVLITPMVAIPVSIAVAILRHKLWDIDRILNRTLVYGLLTAILAGAYALGVLVAGNALSPGGRTNSLVVAATTLAVAAAFQPLRRAIQRVVDRRFNRRRYDAARTIDAFAGRLRQEVDLAALHSDLLAVVDETMGPVSATLWLRPTG